LDDACAIRGRDIVVREDLKGPLRVSEIREERLITPAHKGRALDRLQDLSALSEDSLYPCSSEQEETFTVSDATHAVLDLWADTER
tara:strand:- start:74 stop:331 length:258 start_codon:yes stop_codon:yes gene_type:complete